MVNRQVTLKLFPALVMSHDFYLYIGKLFMNAGLQYRRLESINRSPIFTHFTETIAGVTTIRAFGNTKVFLSKMVELVDNYLRPCYSVWVLNRWISSILSTVSTLLTCFIALLCLFRPEQLSAATAAIFDLIRRTTSIQLSFNSVERVVEYTELDQEPPAIVQPRPTSTWPEQGIIEFNNLYAKYAPDLETVLHSISFKINPKEKVGIVGRTGSGKSTIALSLFRFVEAYQGNILIDGIDNTKIGTTDLRSNMSSVPQHPTFEFILLPNEDDIETSSSGSGNINAFYNLDSTVSQGGLNFSQGQRQLLCLARALLHRRRILVMDEATASVDFRTDEMIQHTISNEFKDCTILCIAHRLLTVIEYDRILVLEHGRVVEFANPYELLCSQDSKFYQMCKNSGEFGRLMSIAKIKHQLIDV
ncbi:P-loop containing nucleoside triphosphate hydrolase protein [Umbelopsis sp. PMI_123]|nr:P-loop containing nucleoside triphosphate hydrolase protein [Umbelopsis sp. PMI_123]